MASADESGKPSPARPPTEPVILGSLKPRGTTPKTSARSPSSTADAKGGSTKPPAAEPPGPDVRPTPTEMNPPDAGTSKSLPEAEAPPASEDPQNRPPEAAADSSDGTAKEDNGEEAANDTPAESAEPEILDTVPMDLSGTALKQAPEEGKLFEACPSCGTLMDVTDEEPFAKIHCPSCGQALRARRQFNHFLLLELIGQGGMGNVFKAKDCNLKRLVALKVLKKELASSPEEREKLAVESRITASIHHPHVVKVFAFGEDHGQFYMAMELVENQSLDDLLLLQRRVPEAQVLEVGIQIAEGLQAAHEKGLIHRDLKPGNILFADAHTAKLVDFGLAIVADEAAAATGEIWGTPYYIAPEKLDNQPEDFRSDIYSLGGTLFHALAGRPPYEADTASMVALKQLKSQPISLQSFAPDVSSETSYVINRMLAKSADDRYDSYDELIEHLSYARTKLLERVGHPSQAKKRVVLETRQTRTITAILSLILLGAVLAVGITVFSFRDKIFGESGGPAVKFAATDFDREFNAAVSLAVEGRFDEARAAFENLASTPGVPQPQLNWARMNAALATLLAGNREAAAAEFQSIQEAGLYATEGPELRLADFFLEASKNLGRPDRPVDPGTAALFSRSNEEAFGLLAFAIHNWQLGKIDKAAPILRQFLAGRPPRNAPWIADYRPLAEKYNADAKLLVDLERRAKTAKTPAEVKALREQIDAARAQLTTGTAATDALDRIADSLPAK